jgi:hypothetical protein
MKVIAPKTTAAIGAGSISIALVEVLAWIFSYWNIVIPPGVGASLATIFAGLGSYFAPRSHSEPTPGYSTPPTTSEYPPTTPL